MMSPREEAINNQYELYKQKKAQREAEAKEKEQFHQDGQQRLRDYWNKKLSDRKPVKTIVEHLCHTCNCIIAKGSLVWTNSVIMAGGDVAFGHFETRYFCPRCKPTGEECKFFSDCGNSESGLCLHGGAGCLTKKRKESEAV